MATRAAPSTTGGAAVSGYRFTVRAFNTVGSSGPSARSNVVAGR